MSANINIMKSKQAWIGMEEVKSADCLYTRFTIKPSPPSLNPMPIPRANKPSLRMFARTEVLRGNRRQFVC